MKSVLEYRVASSFAGVFQYQIDDVFLMVLQLMGRVEATAAEEETEEEKQERLEAERVHKERKMQSRKIRDAKKQAELQRVLNEKQVR